MSLTGKAAKLIREAERLVGIRTKRRTKKKASKPRARRRRTAPRKKNGEFRKKKR